MHFIPKVKGGEAATKKIALTIFSFASTRQAIILPFDFCDGLCYTRSPKDEISEYHTRKRTRSNCLLSFTFLIEKQKPR